MDSGADMATNLTGVEFNPAYSMQDMVTYNISNYNLTTTMGPYLAPSMNVWQATLMIFFGSIISIMAVFGNALVCLSVALVRKLRTPSNLLIVSLAISDFSVGLFVMPFSVMYSVTGSWLLGRIACELWVSADILLCTASILSLCAISIDRYFVITRPFKYAVKRTPRRMVLTIVCVWFLSFLICVPPLIISPLTSEGPRDTGSCEYSKNVFYQIYATFCAFYIPLGVMIFVYYRIYMVSHKIAREEAKSKPSRETAGVSSGLITPLRIESDENSSHVFNTNGKARDYKHSDASKNSADRICNLTAENSQQDRQTGCCNLRIACCIRAKLKGKESKATKTLGVIMGAFTACWLPFFILQLISPFLKHPEEWIPSWLGLILYWLGYANSSLNPLIYARFNREFRQPFKEILLFRCKNINNRIRMNTYTEQYGGALPSMQTRNSLKPPQASIVKYDSHGQTIVKLGNGNSLNNNGNIL